MYHFMLLSATFFTAVFNVFFRYLEAAGCTDGLSQYNLDLCRRAGRQDRQNVAFDFFAVERHLGNASAHMIGIADFNLIAGSAEGAADLWKFHAAVPVSQLFFACPKFLASRPAII